MKGRWSAAAVSIVVVSLVAVGASVDGVRATAQRSNAARSLLVYPQDEVTLNVNHAHPEHRKLRCQRCHVGTTRSTRSVDSLIPREQSCEPCHAEAIDRKRESKETCGSCHRDYGERAPRHVPSTVVLAPRLRFSHQVHARQGVRCLDCHEGIDRASEGTRDHLPTMRSCFRCHGGPKPSAPVACGLCHETHADGRLVTHYSEGWMDPPSWLGGMRHDRDFLTRHRWVGADHGDLCSNCHREEDCTECHDGRTQRLQIHPNDYLSIHPAESRRDGNRCIACHSSQTFCNECHSRLGLSTVSPSRLRVGSRYHPPSEVWSSGPQWHGREARRSLDSCTSCHVERDCVVCHGATGVGGGVSPHPPGFPGACTALRSNPRACTTCHGDLRALRARCR